MSNKWERADCTCKDDPDNCPARAFDPKDTYEPGDPFVLGDVHGSLEVGGSEDQEKYQHLAQQYSDLSRDYEKLKEEHATALKWKRDAEVSFSLRSKAEIEAQRLEDLLSQERARYQQATDSLLLRIKHMEEDFATERGRYELEIKKSDDENTDLLRKNTRLWFDLQATRDRQNDLEAELEASRRNPDSSLDLAYDY